MRLKDALENYYTFSTSLSNVNRQLCFAGIAVVWVFVVKGENGSHELPSELIFPLGCFVLGLALDLCHYISATIVWGLYHRNKEKCGVSPETEFGAPHIINWPAILFFWAKVISTLIGYVSLVKLLIS